VERQLEADREFAVNSPMPDPEIARQSAWCQGEGCHEITFKYQAPKYRGARKGVTGPKESQAAVHLK